MCLTTGSPFLRHLSSVPEWSSGPEHPFNIPAFAAGIDLEIRGRVTFLVGENGSGKSTLLEALAECCGFNPDSEDEVKAVCDFLRLQGDPVYDDDILRPRDEEDEGSSVGRESDDPLYDRAVSVVAQAGYCSISHIQRNLSIGYNKAAKLVERMESEGVVGPASGKAGGRREVLVEAR
jgi:S-DNA-T family DNA segregation ATPase FtsK/SpoIIIE